MAKVIVKDRDRIRSAVRRSVQSRLRPLNSRPSPRVSDAGKQQRIAKFQKEVTEYDRKIEAQEEKIRLQEERIRQTRSGDWDDWVSKRNSLFGQLDALTKQRQELRNRRNQSNANLQRAKKGLRRERTAQTSTEASRQSKILTPAVERAVEARLRDFDERQLQANLSAQITARRRAKKIEKGERLTAGDIIPKGTAISLTDPGLKSGLTEYEAYRSQRQIQAGANQIRAQPTAAPVFLGAPSARTRVLSLSGGGAMTDMFRPTSQLYTGSQRTGGRVPVTSGGLGINARTMTGQYELFRSPEAGFESFESAATSQQQRQAAYWDKEGFRRIERFSSFATGGYRGGVRTPLEERGAIGQTAELTVSGALSGTVGLGGAVGQTIEKSILTGRALVLPETRKNILPEFARTWKQTEKGPFSFLPGGTPINPEGASTLLFAGVGAGFYAAAPVRAVRGKANVRTRASADITSTRPVDMGVTPLKYRTTTTFAESTNPFTKAQVKIFQETGGKTVYTRQIFGRRVSYEVGAEGTRVGRYRKSLTRFYDEGGQLAGWKPGNWIRTSAKPIRTPSWLRSGSRQSTFGFFDRPDVFSRESTSGNIASSDVTRISRETVRTPSTRGLFTERYFEGGATTTTRVRQVATLGKEIEQLTLSKAISTRNPLTGRKTTSLTSRSQPPLISDVKFNPTGRGSPLTTTSQNVQVARARFVADLSGLSWTQQFGSATQSLIRTPPKQTIRTRFYQETTASLSPRLRLTPRVGVDATRGFFSQLERQSRSESAAARAQIRPVQDTLSRGFTERRLFGGRRLGKRASAGGGRGFAESTFDFERAFIRTPSRSSVRGPRLEIGGDIRGFSRIRPRAATFSLPSQRGSNLFASPFSGSTVGVGSGTGFDSRITPSIVQRPRISTYQRLLPRITTFTTSTSQSTGRGSGPGSSLLPRGGFGSGKPPTTLFGGFGIPPLGGGGSGDSRRRRGRRSYRYTPSLVAELGIFKGRRGRDITGLQIRGL